METIRRLQHLLFDYLALLTPGAQSELERKAQNLIRVFETDLKPQSSILDIGAGTGIMFRPLQNRGHRVTLLDVKRYRCCPHPVTLYDGKRIPFDDKSFDVSILITMLHHVSDPEAVLSEAKRVTREAVVVIEAAYETWPGRCFAIARCMFLNLEFVGHPRNFRSYRRWQETFGKLGFSLQRSGMFYMMLLGMPMRQSVYILKP